MLQLQCRAPHSDNGNYNTECATILVLHILLTWAVSNPIYIVSIIYDWIPFAHGIVALMTKRFLPSALRLARETIGVPEAHSSLNEHRKSRQDQSLHLKIDREKLKAEQKIHQKSLEELYLKSQSLVVY